MTYYEWLLLVVVFFFMGYFGLQSSTYAQFLLTAALLFHFVWTRWMTHAVDTPFDVAFCLIAVGLACNLISSVHYENTRPLYVICAYYPYIAVFILYVICYLNIDTDVIENVLSVSSVIFCLLYIGNFLFNGHDNVGLDPTSLRIRMPGSALSAFAVVYGLNKLLCFRDLKYMLHIVLGVTVIMLMSFRTMTVAIILVIGLMSYECRANIRLWHVIAVLVALLALYSVPTIQEKIDYMVEKQQDGDQTFSNPEYERLIGLEYYMNNHFKSGVEYFFGSGLEVGDSKYQNSLRDLTAIHMGYVDWGILGVSWMLGIITAIGMLLYSVQTVCFKYPDECCYIRYFFVYMLLCSITTNEFARYGNYVIQALVLYLAMNSRIVRMTCHTDTIPD